MTHTFRLIAEGKTDLYEELSLPFTKSKKLLTCYQENPSLKIFVEEVKNKTITLV